MADNSHDMLSIYGMNMGIDVASNQRLNTARAIRADEERNAEGQDEEAIEEQATTTAATQRRLHLLANQMPWIPKKKRHARLLTGPAITPVRRT